mmetsp:Transcript_21514/g.39354  ORF Transcript_21514/g.39354 Transcript_21514/m.39354 type:complete len:114 (+) Transcript_21514:528-869(+)
MPVEQDEQLWEALNTHSKDRFIELTQFFKDADPSGARYLPIRIVTAQGTTTLPFKAIEGEREATLQDLIARQFPGEQKEVMIQGVRMPLEATLWWCWQQMSHPDQFLYVIIGQ